MRKICGILLVLTIAGCGGGSTPAAPTSAQTVVPTPTPVPVLTVTGGDTGKPIAGAQVVVAGVPLTTDANGQVRPTSVPNGATIDIIAPGYLDRQTLLRTGADALSRFSLWPRQPLPQFNEDYTKALIYTSSSFGNEGASDPLRRLASRTSQIRVVLPPEIASDSTAVFFHQFAADNMNTAVAGLFRYTVGAEALSGALSVPVSINPAGASCTGTTAAYASVGSNGLGEITSIAITYCAARWARDGRVILHEMGHTLGLRHSTLRSDVMYPVVSIDVFTERELLLMKLMYQRPPGNAFPDNDRSTAGLAAPREETIVCAR
jgi:hypothetical protein